MNWSRNRIIVACLLAAALALMLCPPWRGTYYHGHRLLWNGRGSLDWSRLALELCLVVVIGALMAVVAPMVGHPAAIALKFWLRRVGLALGCAAVVILAVTAGYDGIIRIVLLRDYNRKVHEFQAKAPLLQEAFPLNAETGLVADEPWIVVNHISNVHEAELMLRSLGCDERGIQRASARFLSASTLGYALDDPTQIKHDAKILTFVIGTSDGKGGNCLPKDIFDQVAAKAGPAAKETREIGFDFQIRDSDAAKQFFAPLPDWYAEALQHNIAVASMPPWMTPGEPPASWSFTDWLGLRTPWLILAAGMLALSVLSFVVANRIDRTTATNSVGATT